MLDKALTFAYNYHLGQFRKDGITPYIVHPIEVMRLLQGIGIKNEEILSAALLHDVLEDTVATADGLRMVFNKRIESIVSALTHDPSIPKADYIATFKDAPYDVVIIKAADRIVNVYDFMQSDRKYAKKYFDKAKSIFDRICVLLSKDTASEDVSLRNLYYRIEDLEKEFY